MQPTIVFPESREALPRKPTTLMLTGLPPSVRDYVKHAVQTIGDVKAEIDRATALEERVGQAGRYQADVHLKFARDVARAMLCLEKFRSLAPANNVDADAVIELLGGLPSLTPSAEAQAWLDDPRGAVLPRRKW